MDEQDEAATSFPWRGGLGVGDGSVEVYLMKQVMEDEKSSDGSAAGQCLAGEMAATVEEGEKIAVESSVRQRR